MFSTVKFRALIVSSNFQSLDADLASILSLIIVRDEFSSVAVKLNPLQAPPETKEPVSIAIHHVAIGVRIYGTRIMTTVYRL